jgi:hypothetical protein
MGIDSGSNGSENGNGRGPVNDGLRPDEEPAHDVFGRLVVVMLREAVARRSNEIQIDVGEDCCPVHFVRGTENLEMDSLPVRIFGPFKDHVASMCGKEDCQGQGTFSATLKGTETSAKAYGEVKVSVVFGDSSLRLTIANVQNTSP